MRVLVTGAAGFVGTAAAEILGREHWLRRVDVMPMLETADGDTMVADLASYIETKTAVEGIEAVVHLAAVIEPPGGFESPEAPMQATVVATANLLEAARRAGIQRFILMSSGAVVTGYSRDTFIHVELPHKFQGLYCLTKSLQESLATQYAEEHDMVIPALRPWSVVDGRTYSSRTGEPLQKDNPNYFGLVCRYDLAEACLLALSAPLTGFEPFHIASTAESRLKFDMDRTEKRLGWHPAVTFADLAPESSLTGQPLSLL